MGLRAKWFLCALTCLAAVLTAATFAYAVDQTSKNGCTSPQAYTGALTSPPFTPGGGPEFGALIQFRGWFEIESVAPGGFDRMTVEYSEDAGASPRNWIAVDNGDLTSQSATPGPGDPPTPYSNMGTGAPPAFQNYAFNLPLAEVGVAGVQVRIKFDTGDSTYQGFRGLGIDSMSIETNISGLTENFDNGAPPGWTFDGPSGPGGPFWQVLQNPQNVQIRSPEVNPDLITLSPGDTGALPPADSGTGVAWFGNTDSGTFCGPDFASRDAAPETTITSAPPASTASNDANFEFTSNEQAFFECQIDGGGFSFCSSPQSYPGLSEGNHTFEVRATDFTGNVDPTPASYAWNIRPATLADLPNPELGVDVNVQEVSGTVLVGIPGSAARASGKGRASQKGVHFVPLSEAKQIPVGSFVDTRKGTVGLESAANATGKRQRGTFNKGLFQVRQSKKRSAKGLTDLILKGGSFRRCRARRSSTDASASLSRAAIRRLRASARGRYRTSGQNSAATVRGTKWEVIDRCDGTLTIVRRGTVVVRDFHRKKNVIVKKGKSYLAKARR
jgi:hypothetical protein